MRQEENNRIIADENVAKLLRALPRVDSPGDFEAGVRARIARGAGNAGSASWLFSLRFALPVLLVAMISFAAVGVFLTRPDESASVAPAPTAAPTAVPEITEARPASTAFAPLTDDARPPAVVARNTAVQAVPRTERLAAARRDVAPAPKGFSTDQTVRGPKTVIVPKGVDPTSGNVSVPEKDFSTSAPLNVRELLSFMGIEGERSEAGWKVKSAAAGGIAEHSGVKAGDVIEAVDDRPLTDGSPVSGFTFKSVQVLRNGTRVRVQLRNK
jgi:hypothetical protein